MADQRDPIDQTLKAMFGDPEPTPEEEARALARFQRAMEERSGRRRRSIPWRVLVAAGLAAVAVGMFLVLPRQETAAAAALREIARLVDEIDPLDAPDGTFSFVRSEQVLLMEVHAEGVGRQEGEPSLFYRLPLRRDSWLGIEGTLQLSTTASEPLFFAPADRTLYYEYGIDQQDAIGETQTFTVVDAFDTVWATGGAELDSQIRGILPPESTRPEHVDYLDIALQVIRESPASPETRASVLRLIADLEGIEHVDGEPDVSSFWVEFEESGVLVRWTFAVDSAGFLRSESRTNMTAGGVLGLAAGTSTFEAEYSAPLVVTGLDPRP